MKSVLVKLDVAAALLEKSPGNVLKMVDGGSLRDGCLLWVFNLATNPKAGKRDLRLWRSEIEAVLHKAPFPITTLHQALEKILPVTVANWAPGRLCVEFQIRDNTLIKLRHKINQPAGMIPRAKLAAFLSRRWTGAGP